MQEIKNWKLKRVIKIVEKIAEQKINQGVLLKELAHSIQAHQKDKTAEEWKEIIFKALNSMVEREQEILK